MKNDSFVPFDFLEDNPWELTPEESEATRRLAKMLGEGDSVNEELGDDDGHFDKIDSVLSLTAREFATLYHENNSNNKRND